MSSYSVHPGSWLILVCLGHQSIGQVFGGSIVRAKAVMHGKVSPIYHNGEGVFADLPNPYNATRYHSLVIDQASLPKDLAITAWTQNADGSIDEIMGVRHQYLQVEGVQFHPESILTEHGHAGADYHLHGPDTISGPGAAEVYAKHLDRKAFYGGDDVDAWGKPVEAFLPPWLLGSLKQMFLGQQQNGGAADAAAVAASAEAVGHPLRTFDAFVAEHTG